MADGGKIVDEVVNVGGEKGEEAGISQYQDHTQDEKALRQRQESNILGSWPLYLLPYMTKIQESMRASRG